MNDVLIGTGKLAGKGVYACRSFKKGEVVIKYYLKPLSEDEFEKLPRSEKRFTHFHWGQIFLYSEPERYVNNSKTPNTYQDHELQADIALKDIQKGEMITTDATKDDVSKSKIIRVWLGKREMLIILRPYLTVSLLSL